MTLLEFIKEKSLFLLLQVFLSFVLGALLFLIWPVLYLSIFIPFTFLLGSICSLLWEYHKKSCFYNNLKELLLTLDRHHLLSDILKCPDFFEGIQLYDTIRQMGKSMNDEIAQYRITTEEYQSYLELWVHEIKTPIAAAKLICENASLPSAVNELSKIDFFVEQSLFFSRIQSFEQDFLLKKTSLEELTYELLKSNMTYLIQKQISIETENLSYCVMTDKKWVLFILRQIMDNSVKYQTKALRFCGKKEGNKIYLSVTDWGIGILKQDLERVFEKGFTGENGRQYQHSTGMGLYLCHMLCNKLGLELMIQSVPGQGTTVVLVFPETDLN